MRAIQPKRRRSRLTAGALLIDVVIGMFFLVMTTLTLMSLFPVIKKGEQMSSERSKAVQMSNRILEHIQMLGANDITYDNLLALNLIDTTSTAQPYSFTHVPLDEASRYSPAQALRNADAKITVDNIAGGSKRVIVSIQYVSDTGRTEVVKTGTVVGAFR